MDKVEFLRSRLLGTEANGAEFRPFEGGRCDKNEQREDLIERGVVNGASMVHMGRWKDAKTGGVNRTPACEDGTLHGVVPMARYDTVQSSVGDAIG